MPIIYLTANSESETLQRAKDTLPSAYLLKPFRQQELVVQVELAHANRKTAPAVAESDTLYLPINKGYEKLTKSKVLYLDADGAYVKVYLLNEEQPRLFSMNLGHLLPYFSSTHFYKLSRSVLVNLDFVERLEGNQLWVRNQSQSLSIPNASRAELMRKLTVVRTP
jgi:DNA-binding LytR/AlgR family response regulator